MHRKFIAIILASALAITGLNARAAAAGNSDDIAKWIAGIATLAIIGAAISNQNDRKSKPRKQHGHGQNYHWQYSDQGQGNLTRERRKARHAHALPGRCRTAATLQGHKVRGYSARCLQRSNVDIRALPRHCAVRFRDRSRNQPVTLFTSSCLRQHGYRVAQR